MSQVKNDQVIIEFFDRIFLGKALNNNSDNNKRLPIFFLVVWWTVNDHFSQAG